MPVYEREVYIDNLDEFKEKFNVLLEDVYDIFIIAMLSGVNVK